EFQRSTGSTRTTPVNAGQARTDPPRAAWPGGQVFRGSPTALRLPQGEPCGYKGAFRQRRINATRVSVDNGATVQKLTVFLEKQPVAPLLNLRAGWTTATR